MNLTAIFQLMRRYNSMQWTKCTGILLLCLWLSPASAQITGGQFAMEYLRLADAPHISALGGINVSNPDEDVSFALQNPALARPSLHNQLELSDNVYYSGINIMNLQYGYHAEKINTSFAFGVKYLNYGTFSQTDAAGNQYGDFHANDYALSLAASHRYGERWRYGATLKWAHSSLFDKTQSALLTDIGINYTDTENHITIGAVAKNMGVTIKKYNPDYTAEPLPFDLQIGASKQFKHLPLRLIGTIHHLYEWDIRYDNLADITTSTLTGSTDTTHKSTSGNFADKLFRHFIFGAEILLQKRIVLSVSYNHLRHQEMALQDQSGLTGFSFGAGIYLNKFQIHYARSYYYIGGAYNEFGLNMALNKIMSNGSGGEKTRWNKEYKDWE